VKGTTIVTKQGGGGLEKLIRLGRLLYSLPMSVVVDSKAEITVDPSECDHSTVDKPSDVSEHNFKELTKI